MTAIDDGPLPALPAGRLVRSRVVADPGAALAAALDRSLTGYALLEPQDALLLDADAAGAIAFRKGVPVAAYHAGTGRGGPAALADLAVPGPYSAELYATDRPVALGGDAQVSPGLPAERLAGDPDLADRTREVARSLADRPGSGGDAGPTVADESARGSAGAADPDPDRTGPRDPPAEEWTDVPRERSPDRDPERGDAVAAFLEDERKIEAIRERASEQARRRADEWGLTEHLVDDPEGEG